MSLKIMQNGVVVHEMGVASCQLAEQMAAKLRESGYEVICCPWIVSVK